jgi:hypothetical protein
MRVRARAANLLCRKSIAQPDGLRADLEGLRSTERTPATHEVVIISDHLNWHKQANALIHGQLLISTIITVVTPTNPEDLDHLRRRRQRGQRYYDLPRPSALTAEGPPPEFPFAEDANSL